MATISSNRTAINATRVRFTAPDHHLEFAKIAFSAEALARCHLRPPGLNFMETRADKAGNGKIVDNRQSLIGRHFADFGSGNSPPLLIIARMLHYASTAVMRRK